jgi:cytoskeletal protein CcmA (bactofilin family)
MFSKTPNNPPPTPPAGPPTRLDPASLGPDSAQSGVRKSGQKLTSLVANDMTLEGNITGGGELQVDGTIKGDVRVERVTIGDTGQVDGGVFAEAVEVRGKVSGSITAKQVRLYGACHVDGDITHEQLAMETGAFFQGRSLRLQRPPAPRPEPSITAPPRHEQPAPASTTAAASSPSTPTPATSSSSPGSKDAGALLGGKPGGASASS